MQRLFERAFTWMGGRFETILVAIGRKCGYQIEPLYRPVLKNNIPAGSKLHVGCGDQLVEGYVHCDLRPLPHVDLACRAWEVSRFATGLNEIYSRHMLEHLTYAEAVLTLRDWHQALSPNGLLRIEVPNIRFAIQQWLRAKWSKEALENRYSDARWGFAGFFGWQRECDPSSIEYNQSYWDVHKSGYDENILRFLLDQAGFEKIQVSLDGFSAAQLRRRKLAPHASDQCHLVALGWKRSEAERAAA